MFKAEEIGKYLKNSQAKLIITDRQRSNIYNLYHEAKNLAETAQITEADTILEPVLRGEIIVEVPFIFRRNHVLKLLETEKVTILPIVPYIVEALAGIPPDVSLDLSNLRLCFSAGNSLSKETFVKFLQR